MAPCTLRPFTADDADWLVAQHGRLYARDDGFDASFGTAVAAIVADFLRDADPHCERGWVAVNADGQRLGSIFCVRRTADTAQLRLFLVLPEARGQGLGQRLLSTCLEYARATGYARLQLFTHASHRAACRLYARNGLEMIEEHPVRSYGQDLVEQCWQIAL